MRIHGFLFSLLFITSTQSSALRADLWVKETDSRFLLTENPPRLALVIENPRGSAVTSRINVELLDTEDRVLSRVEN